MVEIVLQTPYKLRVGGHEYTIELSLVPRESNWRGETNHLTRKIRIDPTCPIEADKECTLWHEILHSINSVYNDGEIKEREIAELGEGLFQAMQELGIRIILK